MLFCYSIQTKNLCKTIEKKELNFSVKVFVFFLFIFLKNFIHKTKIELVDKESFLKIAFTLYFFSMIWKMS